MNASTKTTKILLAALSLILILVLVIQGMYIGGVLGKKNDIVTEHTASDHPVFGSPSREGYELMQVVVLSRHNMRSPMSGKGSVLDSITPHEWFSWSSDASELSLRGGVLETEMGQYFRKWLESEGLFQENYHPAENEVRIYANSKQRTIATAEYFVSGLLPTANIPIETHGEYDKMDPVFNPQLTFISPRYNNVVQSQITDLFTDDIESLSDNYELLSDVIDLEESEAMADGSVSAFSTDDTKIILEAGKEPAMKGSLKTACSVSDALVLQYYEEPDPVRAAFGNELSEEQWKQISEIKDVYGDVLFTSPLVAANVANPLLREIHSELTADGRVFSFLCGHDSNVGSVLAALKAEPYTLPDAIEAKTPIGCKLVFCRWQGADGSTYITADLVYQTVSQLRSAALLDLKERPQCVSISFGGLKANANGMYSEQDFMKLLESSIAEYDRMTEAYPASDPAFKYEQDSVRSVKGRQGVCVEGDYYWVSGSASLTKYDADWNEIASNDDPFRGFDIEVNHIGDIDVYNNELYLGVEYFMDGEGKNIQVAVFDGDTLELKRVFPFRSDTGQLECSGIAADPDSGTVYMSSWIDDESSSYLYMYDLYTGEYKGAVRMEAAPKWLQGVACCNGSIYVTSDDGDADRNEADHLYRIDIGDDGTTAAVILEKTFDDVLLQGEIEGLNFDPVRKELLLLYNRGARIAAGMPNGFYDGYTEEIHEVYVYDLK